MADFAIRGPHISSSPRDTFMKVRQLLEQAAATQPTLRPIERPGSLEISADWGAVGGGSHAGHGHGASVSPYRPVTGGKAAGLRPEIQSRLGELQGLFPGLRLSSGYRDPAHNARVGGVPNSYHTQGRAIDLVGSAKDMYDAAAWARMNGAREVLVHNKGSGVHLHVAW